jgi:hypothetical protein
VRRDGLLYGSCWWCCVVCVGKEAKPLVRRGIMSRVSSAIQPWVSYGQLHMLAKHFPSNGPVQLLTATLFDITKSGLPQLELKPAFLQDARQNKHLNKIGLAKSPPANAGAHQHGSGSCVRRVAVPLPPRDPRADARGGEGDQQT